MLFTRKPDAALASLAKQLDEKVAQHNNRQLAVFVNFLGEDSDDLKTTATLFGDANQLANIPLVVPVEHAEGPQNLRINPDAQLTVLIYRDQKVVANHAVGPDGLNKKRIAQILADTEEMLK